MATYTVDSAIRALVTPDTGRVGLADALHLPPSNSDSRQRHKSPAFQSQVRPSAVDSCSASVAASCQSLINSSPDSGTSVNNCAAWALVSSILANMPTSTATARSSPQGPTNP